MKRKLLVDILPILLGALLVVISILILFSESLFHNSEDYIINSEYDISTYVQIAELINKSDITQIEIFDDSVRIYLSDSYIVFDTSNNESSYEIKPMNRFFASVSALAFSIILFIAIYLPNSLRKYLEKKYPKSND